MTPTIDEQIADLMTDRLAVTPGWDGREPADINEARRIAARIEAEIQWFWAHGWDCKDHVRALTNLREHVSFFEADDALARARVFRRAWGLFGV
jgi:hypothetical protein